MGFICYSCSVELKEDIPRLLQAHGIEVKVVHEQDLDFEDENVRFFCSLGKGKASFLAFSKANDLPSEDDPPLEDDVVTYKGDELPIFIFPILPECEKGWKGWFKSRRPTKYLVQDIKKLLLDNGAVLFEPVDNPN